MQTRLTTFDICKGIGIILVVFGHALRGLDNATIEVPYFNEIDQLVYSFHMPLFFIISGYFLSKSVTKHSASSLITSKLHTLMYPYLVWMVIQGFIEFSLSSYTNGNVELWRVFTIWLPRAHFWFLYILMVFTLVYVVAVKLDDRAPIGLMVASILLYFSPLHFESSLYYLYVYVKDNFVYFLIGALFPTLVNRTSQSNSGSLLISTFIVSLFFHAIRLVWLPENTQFANSVNLMTALTTIALIMQFSRRLELGGNRWLVLLGAWSMPIYLAHIIFASGFRIVLMKLGIEHTLLHVVGGTLVGIIGPIILYKLSKSMRFTPLFNSPFIKTAH